MKETSYVIPFHTGVSRYWCESIFDELGNRRNRAKPQSDRDQLKLSPYSMILEVGGASVDQLCQSDFLWLKTRACDILIMTLLKGMYNGEAKCSSGSLWWLLVFFQPGCCVNAAAEANETPLHLVADKGYPDMAEVLLDHGADVNAVDNDGDTPLHLSLQRQAVLKNPMVISTLLLYEFGGKPIPKYFFYHFWKKVKKLVNCVVMIWDSTFLVFLIGANLQVGSREDTGYNSLNRCWALWITFEARANWFND